ncbi:ATPase domain-containing protein [Rubrivirga marina]|uniref:ATPase domain-containing protein n=1 Tax=Rubrivirga marina TaxID=1196024 RepID=UPI0015CD45F9|nr:ATPase domain-containing protein [Rubrivirga marina]
MSSRVSSGVPGFDVLLGGGFPAGRMYLLEGRPGTGKTTFALHFCRAAVEAGERVLYVTLSQRRDELLAIADSHGWDLEGVDVLDVESGGLDLHASDHTLFPAGDVDLVDLMDTVLGAVGSVRPARLVLDSAAELRLLSGDGLRSRRRFLALKHALGQRDVTTLLLDDYSASDGDSAVYSIMHGVVRLERDAPQYGQVYRRLQIPKIRGVDHPTGYHDFRILHGGLEVYPSLTMRLKDEGADERAEAGEVGASRSSRIDGLDAMLDGGLDPGASCVVVGVSGTGKSSLAASYAVAAAEGGAPAAIYTFDERKRTLLDRMEGLGYDLRSMGDVLQVQELSASIMTTGRFIDRVHRDVEAGVRLVVIDSLTGFTHACPGADRAASQLHDLLAYLGGRGVVTLLTVPEHGLLGDATAPQIDISYVADTVLLLQHYEARGEIRKAIAVVKRRRGGHDRRVRQFVMSDDGMAVGDAITDYQGVLTGLAAFVDGTSL